MSDGLHIRWRETAPDRGLLSFALSELDALHGTWPDTLQCNIVIERDESSTAEVARYRALVEIELGRRAPKLRAEAHSRDTYAALRTAFRELKASVSAHADLVAGVVSFPAREFVAADAAA